MSIELNNRVKQLERQLAEVNRQIAELQQAKTPQCQQPEIKRPVGRPRKNDQIPCTSD